MFYWMGLLYWRKSAVKLPKNLTGKGLREGRAGERNFLFFVLLCSTK